jgi:CheY-like chemotaxis protein
MNILIIDDSNTTRGLLRRILQQVDPDCVIREAEDGKAAIHALTQGRFDLIVSDLEMPGVDGHRFLEVLRGNPLLRRKKVLVFSSSITPELRALNADNLNPTTSTSASSASPPTTMRSPRPCRPWSARSTPDPEVPPVSLPASELPIPSPADLQSVLSAVLESFAYAMALPRDGGASADLSVRAELPGGEAWLLLQGSRALAQRLADDTAGGEDPGLAEDAFLELCNLAVSHLSSRLGTDTRRSFRPFVPSRGVPDGRCRSRALMDVDGEPLEASFWTAA